MKKAVFPGSFDPMTIGHVDIVKRALPLFDEIVVAIGYNSEKKYLFPQEQRLEWLEDVFRDDPSVKVDAYSGLTVNYCKKVGARYLLRGVRNSMDFEFERSVSQLNYDIGDGIDTIFLIARPKYSHISSTIVREIIRSRGDASRFLPDVINL